MRVSTYKDIGQSGTDEQLQKAFNKLADGHLYTATNNRVQALIDGAVEAFYAGRPENIQKLFQDGRVLGVSFYYDPAYVLNKISEKGDDKAAGITLALENISEEEKKKVLGKALLGAIDWREHSTESFVGALLKAGADPNADINSGNENILAYAVVNNRPVPVIQLLSDNGADFDKALMFMHSKGYDSKYIDKLKFFEEKMRVPATPVAQPEDMDIRDALKDIRQQLSVLTEKVDRLSVPAAIEIAPQGRQAVRESKPYPSINSGQPKKSASPNP